MISTLSAAVKDILERIGKATRGLIPQIVQDMTKLSAIDQSRFLRSLFLNSKNGEMNSTS